MLPDTNTNCLMKGCNYKYDHLNHIMQTCNYNYNSRIHRHNYINKLLIQYLNKHNYITILEPYIYARLTDYGNQTYYITK